MMVFKDGIYCCHCVVARVKMEERIAAVICEEDADDLLVYLVSEGAADILRKRKDEGYYSSLIGRYLMDSELKFREFCRVSRDIFQFINFFIKFFFIAYGIHMIKH